MSTISLTQAHKIPTSERIWCIDWHPQGTLLAAVGSNKSISLYKAHNATYQLHSTIETQHTKTIRSIKFSHQGDKLAVGSFDSTCSVWVYNGESAEYEQLGVLEGHESQVKCVSWSVDDRKIASCSRDKNIWVWEFDPVSYEYTCESVLQGHTQDIKFVDWFLQEPNKLLSCSYDNTIRIWSYQDDDYICQQVLEGHKSIVWNVQVLDGRLWSASEDCTVMEWKLVEGKYEIMRVYEGIHVLPIYAMCIVNHKYLATGGADNALQILPLDHKKQQQQQQKVVKAIPCCTGYHESDINCLRTNPKFEGIFASCSDDQTIRIWSLAATQ